MQDFFKELYPKSDPGKICGHFRDKNLKECVMLVITKKKSQEMISLVLIENKSFLLISDKIPYYGIGRNNEFLVMKKPGKIRDYPDVIVEKHFELDSIELVFSGSTSARYYWKNDRFNDVQTSD